MKGSWDESTMKKAIQEVKELKKAIKSTAVKYGIPRATLQRHLKTGSCKKKLGRFTTVFSAEQELELLDYVFEMDGVFYGLSKEEFLRLVFEYAEINHIPHPFKDGTAGTDWYKGFIKRHPDLTLRKPEPTSIARARGFNKPQVYRFFDLLEGQVQKHGTDATRIYNMDETGVQTSSNKPPRVLTKIGKRQVGLIASTERGRTTTVICCCNAAGSFIPPFMIFARKKMNSRLLDGAAPGTQGTCTDNGWINGPAFLEWLRFFIETVRPTSDKKIILVLDNHESHKYLPALELASANNVIFVSLAPHTTHRMQPLDYCVYGPLKIYFEQAVASFQKAHAGRIINQNDIAGLFSSAYLKAATAQNAIKGFRTTGIFPTDRYIFDESDFAPATVTENNQPEKSQPEVNDLDRTPSPSMLDQMIQSQIMTSSPIVDLPIDDAVLADGPPINTPVADSVALDELQGTVTENNEPEKSQLEVNDLDRTPSPSKLDQIVQSQIMTSSPIADLPIDDDVLVDGPPVNIPVADSAALDKLQGSTCCTKSTSSTNEVTPILDTWIQETPMTPVKRVPSKVTSGIVNKMDLGNEPSTSKEHFSPMVIRPLPKVGPNKTNRRRKTQRAEILTSTPIKDEQRSKLMKKMKPTKKKEKCQAIAKTLKMDQKNDKKTKKKEKPKKRAYLEKENSPYPCLICNEPYVDPPTEDWIQCDDCKMWAHDACTSYSGIGAFYCDNCQEI